MAAYNDDNASYLSRDGAYLDLSADFTWTLWGRQSGPAASNGTWSTLKIWGDPAFDTDPYLWVGVIHAAGTHELALEVYDGSTFHTTTPVALAIQQWCGVSVVYDAATTTLSLYYATNLTGTPTLADTLTVDLSTITFATTTEQLCASTTPGNNALFTTLSYDRVWQQALIPAQIRAEWDSRSAVTTTNLLADVPLELINNYSDTSGNGRNYVKTGTIQVLFFRCLLTQTRLEVTYQWRGLNGSTIPNPFSGAGSPNGMTLCGIGIGSVNNIATFNGYTVSQTVVGDIIVASSADMRFYYSEDNSTSHPTLLSDPIPGPFIGMDVDVPPTLPRADYLSFIALSVGVRTSTYDVVANTYAEDAKVTFSFGGSLIVSETDVFIKRAQSNPADPFVYLTMFPLGDLDDYVVTQDGDPVASYDFTSGTAPTGWVATTADGGVNSAPGVEFNPDAGVGGSPGISAYNNDPAVGPFGTYTPLDEKRYGGLVNTAFSLPAPGTIIVTKVVIPDSDPQTFDFTADQAFGRLSPGTFTLGHGDMQIFAGVTPGTYAITEDAVPGYLTAVSVSNGSPSSAVHVAEGETVLVIFTNGAEGSTGEIIVQKVTVPASVETAFDFTTTGGLSPETFSLTTGQTQGFVVSPGTYGVAETSNSDFTTTVDVSNDDPASAIVVGMGETVTVTVTNTATVLYPTFAIEESPRRWLRRAPIMSSENRRIFHNFFALDMQVGVGVASGASEDVDPQVMMRYSDDGGNTWSNELWRSMGKIGKYSTLIQWWRLGVARNRVYEVSGSAKVRTVILDGYVDVDPSDDAPKG